ncbi:MAG: YfcC family protein [Gemmatimonas sp.]|nr:YfcC family protein [Gemmatimonas sp.]
MSKLHLPHPMVLLLACVLVAAALTHVLPAGSFDRHEDAATGRTVVVAGTYQQVEAQPVGLFDAFVAVPRGFVAGAEVIVLVLLVGGAWTVVDKAGTLRAIVDWLVGRFGKRRYLAIIILSFAFAAGGALENMGEEIIPLVPVLLLLCQGLGYDAISAAAMSIGAAMVGSAFSPLNPFQAGIALKLAQLPLLSGAGLRTGMLLVAISLWIWWTIRYAERHRVEPAEAHVIGDVTFDVRQRIILALVVAPFVAYIIGVLNFGWGFNELSAAFFMAGIAVGLVGRLGMQGTIDAYFDGMRSVTAAAVLIGVARSISLVLEDGRVIDTILQGLVTPLADAPRATAAMLMVPVQALLHIPVSSVSGQAVLTMPVMVPLSDLLGISRQATVLAYQAGAGLTEFWTPTNGTLMAILLSVKCPYERWLRFAFPMVLLLTALFIAGMLTVL